MDITETQSATIDIDSLLEFVQEAAKIVSRVPIPAPFLRDLPDEVTPAEAYRLWLAAGVATHVGFAIMSDPLIFVNAAE